MILLLGLAAFTPVSEDLAAISAGLLIARGQTSFVAAILASFAGIYVGDLLLFLAGRYLGRPLLTLAPLRWLVGPDEVERALRWLDRRGRIVVALSRLTPGARLPTYVAAGLLRMRFSTFALSFAPAAAVWDGIEDLRNDVLGPAVRAAYPREASAQRPFPRLVAFLVLPDGALEVLFEQPVDDGALGVAGSIPAASTNDPGRSFVPR